MPTAKKPAPDRGKAATSRPRKPAAPRTAAKPAAPATDPVVDKPSPPSRKPVEAAAAATPVAAPAPAAPTRKKDRTLQVAIGFLAAVALFAAGFGIGRASGDDGPTRVFGTGQIQVYPGMGMGRMDGPGMGPGGGMGPGPGMYPDRPGGGYLPGPDRGGGVTPVPTDQGFLGISGTDAAGGGVEVTDVMAGSAAEAAGVAVGDRIVSIGDMPVVGIRQFAHLIIGTQPGTTITLGVDRGGSTVTLSATLGSRAG